MFLTLASYAESDDFAPVFGLGRTPEEANAACTAKLSQMALDLDEQAGEFVALWIFEIPVDVSDQI